MSFSAHNYRMSNNGDERVPTTFSQFFSNYTSPSNEAVADMQLVKVASGCVSCPLAGKSISMATCNSCKFASGIDFKNSHQFIKCSYKVEPVSKTSSAPDFGQVIDFSVPSDEQYQEVKNSIASHIVEELKYAAQRAGVKLADRHEVEFAVESGKLRGKNLERAATKYVSKIQDRIMPEQRTQRISDGFSDSLGKAFASPTIKTELENNRAGGAYLGKLSNPNTVSDPFALDKLANTLTSDEISKKYKQEKLANKEKIKDLYRKEIEAKFNETQIKPSNVVSLHASTDTFNSQTPKSGISMFGDNKEFSNVPEQTDGEKLASIAKERSEKKANSKHEWNQVKGTVKAKSWLFQ